MRGTDKHFIHAIAFDVHAQNAGDVHNGVGYFLEAFQLAQVCDAVREARDLLQQAKPIFFHFLSSAMTSTLSKKAVMEGMSLVTISKNSLTVDG
jgi:hypothetical protein